MTARRRLTIERSYQASLDEVWALWTTKAGIEAWWGPVGFSVTVRDMDLRPGGSLLYVMTATAPEQVAFMKQAGMPLSTEAKVSYTTVEPPRRLAYRRSPTSCRASRPTRRSRRWWNWTRPAARCASC